MQLAVPAMVVDLPADGELFHSVDGGEAAERSRAGWEGVVKHVSRYIDGKREVKRGRRRGRDEMEAKGGRKYRGDTCGPVDGHAGWGPRWRRVIKG